MARVVMGSLVSPLVWVLDLALAALFGDGVGAAEKLTIWSTLQLFGFILILSGTLVYNELGPCRKLCGAGPVADSGISLVEDQS